MLRLAIQQRLERGSDSRLLEALSHVWTRSARVERPLTSPIPVLCIGGATLGGSGKTPLVAACARALCARLNVVVIGHAYRARPSSEPRVVRPDDDVDLVGDEALELARAGLTVVVARRRQDAIDHAAVHADVLLLDGPLQLSPQRATLSLLALDAETPWGSGMCPPSGDLRAPRAALEAATDALVRVRADSRGVWVDDRLLSWSELRPMRVGLATGIARPERVLALLQAQEVVPRAVVRVADHETFRLEHAGHGIDLWLVTGKDAARMGAPNLGVLDYHMDLPPFVLELLTARFPAGF